MQKVHDRSATPASRRAVTILFGSVLGGILLVVACSTERSPTSPAVNSKTVVAADTATEAHANHSAAHGDKGFIDGWFEGQTVQLFYTKSYFCEEPPASGASTDCELGAPAEVAPRNGPIPVIYAIAAAGIAPDLSTLACKPGSVCLNHPAMIDASRVGGRSDGPAVPHSHILTERRGGWFQTVNIRVRSLAAWNQIAAAKNLATVRALQADPNVGGLGLVSADTPTNIFFFIASFR